LESCVIELKDNFNRVNKFTSLHLKHFLTINVKYVVHADVQTIEAINIKCNI
jgi:hypothetical protein